MSQWRQQQGPEPSQQSRPQLLLRHLRWVSVPGGCGCLGQLAGLVVQHGSGHSAAERAAGAAVDARNLAAAFVTAGI